RIGVAIRAAAAQVGSKDLMINLTLLRSIEVARLVAGVERSETRGRSSHVTRPIPGFATLNPGYQLPTRRSERMSQDHLCFSNAAPSRGKASNGRWGSNSRATTSTVPFEQSIEQFVPSHGRACPGHPRLCRRKGADARDKPGMTQQGRLSG